MGAAARSETGSTADREIVQERVFEAPRELVWRAFTDPKHIDKWWGPNGFRNRTHSSDFRVGGTWRFTMHGPDGRDWPNWIRYEEVSAPERLVYAHGGEGDEPHFHVTVTLTELGKRRTKLTMRSVFPSAEAVAAVKKFGAVEGGRQTLARLAGFIPHLEDGTAENAMVLTRLLDAPASAVFAAWTTPKALARWWGPKNFTLPVAEVDFREGGKLRMVMRAPDGSEHGFHGQYTEIVRDRRIAFTSVIDGIPGEVLTLVTFDEEEGRTRLTVRQSVPQLKSAAEGQMQGWSETLEKLGAALQSA